MMAKIKTIQEINVRANGIAILILKNNYIEVSEEMAVFWCNENSSSRRFKKAIRTPENEQNLPHTDYTSI